MLLSGAPALSTTSSGMDPCNCSFTSASTAEKLPVAGLAGLGGRCSGAGAVGLASRVVWRWYLPACHFHTAIRHLPTSVRIHRNHFQKLIPRHAPGLRQIWRVRTRLGVRTGAAEELLAGRGKEPGGLEPGARQRVDPVDLLRFVGGGKKLQGFLALGQLQKADCLAFGPFAGPLFGHQDHGELLGIKCQTI